MLTRLYVVFSDTQGQLTPKSVVEFCQKLELIQALIGVLHTRKNEEDPIKKEGVRVLTSLLLDFSDVRGQLTLKSVVEVRRNSNTSKL